VKKLLTEWRKYLKENSLNYMRGDCALLATAVGDLSGLPTYGVVDADDNIQHVFVYDESTDEGIDCRGRMPVGEIKNNIQGEGLSVREVGIEELQQVFGLNSYSNEEWEEAEEEAASLV
tara:strand:- start:804 stop:1160 length:357 start_codon:yes stop_codon:yes gene_type:complete